LQGKVIFNTKVIYLVRYLGYDIIDMWGLPEKIQTLLWSRTSGWILSSQPHSIY